MNEIRGVVSRYRWKGRLEREEESLLVIKTAQERVAEVIAALEELHPYEQPELLSLAVEQGSQPYLDWVRDETDDCAPPDAPR